MGAVEASIGGIPAWISRPGYIRDDRFEIFAPAGQAHSPASPLLAQSDVLPAWLRVRDSFRLEAGLRLYGSDIDELTTPMEANLAGAIGKRRRIEGGFPGNAVIQD